MAPDVERLIMRCYPQQVLADPLTSKAAWAYDSDFSELRALREALRELDPSLGDGTAGEAGISEELVLFGTLRLQLSYLGPYAAVNRGALDHGGLDHGALDHGALDHGALDHGALDHGAAKLADVTRVLDAHGIALLDDQALAESVAWVRRGRSATTWDCLFAPRGA